MLWPVTNACLAVCSKAAPAGPPILCATSMAPPTEDRAASWAAFGSCDREPSDDV